MLVFKSALDSLVIHLGKQTVAAYESNMFLLHAIALARTDCSAPNSAGELQRLRSRSRVFYIFGAAAALRRLGMQKRCMLDNQS